MTAEDIATGAPSECTDCPLAYAISRHINATPAVFGDVVELDIRRRRIAEQIPLPDVARSFVARFDCGLPVAPFEFDLDIPPQFLRQPEVSP